VSESTTSAKRGLPLRVKMRHSEHFVEELTARHEAPVGKLVPLSTLVPNPDQPRNEVGELSDLVASIRDKGILEPILVRPVEAADDDAEPTASPRGAAYEIVAGERRYRAALEAGLYEVPVIELQVSRQEAFEITLIENLQRKDLSAFEEAEGYRALADLHGYTQEQVARSVGKSRSSVAESLALLAIPAELRRAAESMGIRAKSALLEVAKAGDPARMKALLERAGRHGLSRDDLRKAEKAKAAHAAGRRRKPFTFKFKSPDRRFALNLTFRQSTVERDDLIQALEQILQDLRDSEE
jgi:ParB family chromosome partitioning protein